MTISESALIVPVPEAEPVVRPFRTRFDPAAPAGIPAHITVLYPFKAPDSIDRALLDELGEIFAGVAPFSFTLTSIARFPDVVYLVPEPAESFIRLTAAIATGWPETPPYGGAFDQVIPHVTVAHTDEAETIDELCRSIEPSLPIDCRAEESWLLTSRNNRWRLHERFPFAAS